MKYIAIKQLEDEDKVMVRFIESNPAEAASDSQLLEEYHRRLAQDDNFRVITNCYEDYLIGKQGYPELAELPDIAF